ncbi:HAD ATPase P-type IC family protein [Babesia bovis T2Bo]|uniref:P-type ATPase4, putative n=1 Tax=Babesia bovis TaxID=5865 RepID=A7AS37_BABBO|nr:HAD ATPase P-type IC family protein [Babesia bovis T2Bo]EDO07356.1 HAD ATPase P-type IC family protein [Babesia bovis T2Bo]|eukprot:XP_001610924.1 P-type ATPase4 [Babesia bovis T2Bo]
MANTPEKVDTSRQNDGKHSIEMKNVGDDGNSTPIPHRRSQQSVLNSIGRALSKTIVGTSITSFADNVESEVATRLSKNLMNAEDFIEVARMRDSLAVEKAKVKAHEKSIAAGKSRYASVPVEEIMEEFGVQDLSQGLTDAQCELNCGLYGKNVLETCHKPPLWRIYLGQFCNFVVLLLIAAAIGSMALGNIVEGAFIIVITNINAGMATYMEKSAADALEKLAEISAPTTTVIRNGEEIEIDSKDVVCGDIVILNMGDTVPADVRIVEVKEIKLNEALLTGESEPVKKHLVADDLNAPFATNMCFASTSVVCGSAKGIVVTTGMQTQVGHIATQLKSALSGSDVTPLQSSLNSLGGIIGIISIFVLITIIVVAIVTKYEDPTRPDTNRVLAIVLLAVGFAVSAIPEGLPMVVTISLSLGAKDMADRNANIRKLPAVETLGCCSIICSDKTGTLTEGKMTSISAMIFHNEDDGWKASELQFYPTMGFNPYGGVFKPEHLTDDFKAELQKQTHAAASFDNVTNNVCAKGNTSSDSKQIRACMLSAYLNSNSTRVEQDEASKAWVAMGNMTECPIIVASAKCGIGSTINKSDATYDDHPMLKDLEVPFNSGRKMMVTIHKLKTENMFGDLNLTNGFKTYTHVATIKGAPDMLFKYRIVTVKRNGEECVIDWASGDIENNETLLNVMKKANNDLSSRALRVLLVGMFPLTAEDITALEGCEDSDSRLNWLLNGHEHGSSPLVLLGFIGNLDPPRFGVKEAVATCGKAGVRVVMITGDQKPTATAIGKDIGLFNQFDYLGDENSGVIECSQMHINNDHFREYLPDGVIDSFTSRVSVFCRAQPEDKVVIVKSLKRQGYLTAMTGDGVNDAPALKTADIGVAMGINGTDVAKGAADMVLLDDNFCTIVNSIESGRTIYANIQKFVSFLLGTNIGEIFYLTTAILMKTLPPVEALQILFLNFVTDGCPAVALSREPPEDDVLTTKPRDPGQPIMTRNWWLYGNIPHTIFQGIFVIGSILTALYISTGVIFVKDIHEQCKYVELANGAGTKYRYTYFCKSYEYRVESSYVGWVTNIDYYDPEDKKMKTVLGAAKGMIDTLKPNSEELIPQVKDRLKDLAETIKKGDFTDKVELDANGWIKPKDTQVVSNGKTPIGAGEYGYFDITARKTTQARTMSFITAVWCEMLRAYTVRSWDYFFNVFNRNPWMHIACGISATATFIATILPNFSKIMHLVSLAWWQYLIAIGFAMMTLVLDEGISKVLYWRYAEK